MAKRARSAKAKTTAPSKSPRSTKKAAPKRQAAPAKSAPRSHTHTKGLDGWITHTELASAAPAATKDWARKVFGWQFRPSLPMPDGEYHLFAYSDQGGGGIRAILAGERPGSTPTVHVADCQAAFDKAVREGATAIKPPAKVMDGVTIALVRAPGGVLIGLSGP